MNTPSMVEKKKGGWFVFPDGKKIRGTKAMQKEVLRRRVGNASATRTSRIRNLTQSGLQYAGDRDIYTTAGYIQEGTETYDHYWSLFERNPIAGRVVDMPAKSTWKLAAEVFEGEEQAEQQTDFDKTWKALAKRLRLWKQFEKVDRLARIGKYSVLLLGTKDVASDRQLKEELQPLRGADDLVYVNSFSEQYAKVDKWDTNVASPRFGWPEQYKINLTSGIEGFAANNVFVHHSRVIHVAEDPLLDDVHGRPVLKRVLNALADMLKVSASTGEAYWQLAARILQAKVDPAMEMNDDEVDDMGEALEEMIHDLRRHFVGHGVELNHLQGDPPDPSDPFEVFKALVSVGSGIPTRILFGSERGELASSQDQENYYGMIAERQVQHAEPNILRPFIDRCLELRVLPKPQGGIYSVTWLPLYTKDEAKVAEANKSRAETAKALTPLGSDPMDMVEIDEEGNVRLKPKEAEEESPHAMKDLGVDDTSIGEE